MFFYRLKRGGKFTPIINDSNIFMDDDDTLPIGIKSTGTKSAWGGWGQNRDFVKKQREENA